MKKVVRILGLCALAVFAFTSCNKEKETELTFKASITQPTNTSKTHIGANDSLVWDNGNTIKVFNANGVEGDFTTTDSNVPEATFNGTLPQTSTYTAFYPSAAVNGQAVTLSLNANQNYVDSNFGNDTYPMAAAGTLENDIVRFQFHSPASVLRLLLKSDNNCTVKSITMIGGANDKLAGDIVYNSFTAPESYSFSNTTNTVVLDCGNGVQLAANEETHFNIVVLSGTMSIGTRFEVRDMNGNIIKTLTTTRPNTLTAEHILIMPVMEISYELPNVVTTAATNVTYQTATINGTYSYPAGAPVTSCGFYWGTNQAEVANGTSAKVTATLGTPMSYPLTGLTASTTYYFKAWGVNASGESCGAVMSFTTPAAPTPSVTTNEATNVNSPTGTATTGSATMNGAYNANGTTITEVGFYYADAAATLNNVNNCTKVTISQWTGTTFSYNVPGLAPGTYYYKAYAKTTTEYYGGVKQFTITQPSIPGAYSVSPTRLVLFAPGNLQFNLNPNNPQWRFAPEQWIALGENENITNMWARINYEFPGNTALGYGMPVTIDIENGDHWMDLYCWATSGVTGTIPPYFAVRDNGPNGTSFYRANYSAPNIAIVNHPYFLDDEGSWYMHGTDDINGTTADWGVAHRDELNATISDPDKRGEWRTLTGSYHGDSHPEEGEWYYLMHVRAASTVNGTTNARYAKARIQVDGNWVNGMLLFPDEYTHPSGVAQPTQINVTGSLCSANSYTVAEWRLIEAAGATFLPCSSTRWGWGTMEAQYDAQWYPFQNQLVVPNTNLSRSYADNGEGYYWSSTHRNKVQAGTLRFLNQADGDQPSVDGANNYNRDLGCSVRLARTVRE